MIRSNFLVAQLNETSEILSRAADKILDGDDIKEVFDMVLPEIARLQYTVLEFDLQERLAQ